jgi:tubulin gamma
VIDVIKNGSYGNLFNPENIFTSKDGSGAGNLWAEGYVQGDHVGDDIIDMLDREADNSDSLEVIILCY